MSGEIERLLASSDSRDVYSAIVQIGKRQVHSLVDRVPAFLEDADPELRKAAILTLGLFLRLPAYEAKARAMASSDIDDLVRSAALSAWTAYHAGSHDRAMVEELLGLLLDDSVPPAVRDAAYRGILVVAGVPGERFPKPAYPDVEKRVDWRLVVETVERTGIRPPDALLARCR